jgi:hypothetical protein
VRRESERFRPALTAPDPNLCRRVPAIVALPPAAHDVIIGSEPPGAITMILAKLRSIIGCLELVGAENLCTSRDLGVLVDQPTETIVP